MFSQVTPSNFSEAILTANRIERQFFNTQYLNLDREKSKIRLRNERQMEAFIQITQKRHETWHRYDKYFREALKKEKDRHERRKERLGSAPRYDAIASPSLITLNLRPEPLNKVGQRTYQVIQASQRLLNASATRSRRELRSSRPSTTSSTRKTSATTTKSSNTFNSSSLIVPMTQSIDFDEYNRLMNDSLKRETYADFVEHFVKFRPEFREQFAYSHQISKRNDAVEKIKEFNQTYAKTKDQRYHNLIGSLTDFRSNQKRK